MGQRMRKDLFKARNDSKMYCSFQKRLFLHHPSLRVIERREDVMHVDKRVHRDVRNPSLK